MPYYERTIQENGIRINWVHYYSDVLRRYVNARDPNKPKIKRQFTFRRKPNDISVTYFYDPDAKQYYKVPYRDTSLPPMSEWDFRAARERLSRQGKDDTNERLIAESYEQMREIQEKAAQKTKSARRAQQRRIHNKQIEQPTLSNIPPTEEAPTDAETSLSTDSPSVVIEPFDEIEFL
jgi:putative transposase